MRTLLLDTEAWDLVLDASGNIAVADEPYALAQDAASAIRTFRGECYWDTTIGLPYLTQVLGKSPSPSLVKALIVAEARTVPGVEFAVCYLTGLTGRVLSGQVQVSSQAIGGAPVAADFSVVNPQGA
jgi:hypothetical protein